VARSCLLRSALLASGEVHRFFTRDGFKKFCIEVKAVFIRIEKNLSNLGKVNRTSKDGED